MLTKATVPRSYNIYSLYGCYSSYNITLKQLQIAWIGTNQTISNGQPYETNSLTCPTCGKQYKMEPVKKNCEYIKSKICEVI